ncbi:MAG: hypothetical protein AB8I69_20535 [Anaerolineae bacterium]
MVSDLRIGWPAMVVLASLALLPRATSFPSWQIYAFRDGAFVTLSHAHETAAPSAPATKRPLPAMPADWHVTAAALADVTGDGESEWVLLVWRPWRDWPIQEWVSVPSPITGFHDAAGDSCHLILLDPQDGREIWAGSALPAPLLALAVGDVDGDEIDEVVTLEGDYATGRDGTASHVDVWQWDEFGFSLEWRSPQGAFRQLCLTDVGDDRSLGIAVR